MSGKITRTLIIYSLFFLAVLPVFSQTYSIRGVVQDKNDNTPLAFAHIMLSHSADSTRRKGTLTDIEGNFKFENISPGNYNIKVSFFGYKPYNAPVKVNRIDVKDLVLQMKPDVLLLENVEISTVQTRVTQKGDTTEFNANAYKVNADASAEDLVSKMPGITVDNGTVKSGGEDVKNVFIDGEKFFGAEAATALKNLPAEIIDKIQVYDKQSEQAEFTGFKDGNTEKTINVKTKQGKNNGQFGKAQAGYGTSERYKAGGNVNLFNGRRRISLTGFSNNINQHGLDNVSGRSSAGRGAQGINTLNSLGLHYSDTWKKWKLNGSYSLNETKNEVQSTLDRLYFLSDTSNQTYAEINSSESKNFNHRVFMQIRYEMDSFNTLIINPTLNFHQNTSSRFLESAISSADNNLLNTTSSHNTTNQNGFNFSNSILYLHKFNKKGRTVSLHVKGDTNEKEGEGALNSSSFLSQSIDTLETLQQRSITENNTSSYSAGFVYTEPLGQKGLLSFNYNPSYSIGSADKKTNALDLSSGEYTLQDSLLSNIFDNEVEIHRGGLNYVYNTPKINFTSGLEYQKVNLYGKQSFPGEISTSKDFYSFLPKAELRYVFSKSSNLRLRYHTNTQTPSILQLQNVLDNTNPFLLSTGNADLKQEYTHSLNMYFSRVDSTKTKPLFALFSLSQSSDYIGNSTTIAGDDTVVENSISLYKGAQISKPVNLNGYLNFRSFLTYGLPVTKIKSNLNLNAGFTYNRTPALINSARNFSNTFNINGGSVLSSNISEKIDFKISYSANYNIVKNSIQPLLNNNYYAGVASAFIYFMPWKKWVLRTDLNQNHRIGLDAAYSADVWLWNAGVGYKFLKDNSMELNLSLNDILNQNKSIQRNVTETYVEDVRTNTLQRYVMLTLMYNLRKFK